MPEDVLALGRALVKELGLDPGVDTLCRWMAHYIAELITDAETAKAEDRSAKFSLCADAIFKLWEHRFELPDGKRPFEDFEPILRAFESLDPTNNTPRYFRYPRQAINNAKQNAETKKWLELADGFDYSARSLISYCLVQASQTALRGTSKEWVKLAEAVGLENDINIPVIRFISHESDLLNKNDHDETERKILKERIKRLDGFRKLAESLSSDLRLQLKQSKSSPSSPRSHPKKAH